MRLALRNLNRRRTRTAFAVLGITIGIAAVVGLISLARGFRQEVDDLLTRLRGDIVVKEKNKVAPQSSRIDEALVAEIAGLDGVAAISGYTIQLLYFGDLRVPVYGFAPDQPIMAKLRIVEGRRIAMDGLGEVMLGAEAARTLGVAAGDVVTVPPDNPHGQEVAVVGIYSTGSRYQDFGCVLHLRTGQLVSSCPGQVMMLAIDSAAADGGVALRDRLRRGYPALEFNLSREFTEQMSEFQMVTRFAWAVSAIAAVVGAIGVINTMLMSVAERTREIGTLLALGWSRGRVLRMILAEGFLVSLVGGVAGILAGVILVEVVSHVLQDLPIVAGHDAVLFVQALGLALGLGTLGSILPAYKAARMSPVEALRHE